jgi:hypothetical protein
MGQAVSQRRRGRRGGPTDAGPVAVPGIDVDDRTGYLSQSSSRGTRRRSAFGRRTLVVSSITENVTRVPPADLSKIAQAARTTSLSRRLSAEAEAGAYEETARWETGRQACPSNPRARALGVPFSTVGMLTSGIRSRESEKCTMGRHELRRHHTRLLAQFDAAPPRNRSGPSTSGLPALNGSCVQFIRIPQLQAQLDVVLGALRRSPDGVHV